MYVSMSGCVCDDDDDDDDDDDGDDDGVFVSLYKSFMHT